MGAIYRYILFTAMGNNVCNSRLLCDTETKQNYSHTPLTAESIDHIDSYCISKSVSLFIQGVALHTPIFVLGQSEFIEGFKSQLIKSQASICTLYTMIDTFINGQVKHNFTRIRMDKSQAQVLAKDKNSD